MFFFGVQDAVAFPFPVPVQQDLLQKDLFTCTAKFYNQTLPGRFNKHTSYNLLDQTI